MLVRICDCCGQKIKYDAMFYTIKKEGLLKLDVEFCRDCYVDMTNLIKERREKAKENECQ